MTDNVKEDVIREMQDALALKNKEIERLRNLVVGQGAKRDDGALHIEDQQEQLDAQKAMLAAVMKKNESLRAALRAIVDQDYVGTLAGQIAREALGDE